MEEDSAEIQNLAKSTSADFFFLGSLTHLDLESSRRLGKLATDCLQFDSENCYTSDPDNILEFSKMTFPVCGNEEDFFLPETVGVRIKSNNM